MKLKPIDREEAQVIVSASPERLPVEGNAGVTEDLSYNPDWEQIVLDRMVHGTTWAWARVTVTVEWNGLYGETSVGCCSYRDEKDFRSDRKRFDGLVERALVVLNRRMREMYHKLKVRELRQ